MKQRNKLLLVLAFSLMSFVQAAGLQVIKAISDSLWVNEKLAKGVDSNLSRFAVRKNISISLKNFIKKDGDAIDLKKIESLRKYVLDSEDLKMFDSMVNTLKSDSDKVTPEQLVELGNQMAFISQRYGFRKLGVLSCAKCVDARVTGDKVVYKLSEFATDSASKIYERILSKKTSPKSMRTYIKGKLRSLKLGNLQSILKFEEEKLAFTLSIPRYGDKDLKEAFSSLKRISKNKSGQVDLFDGFNNHKFWTVLSDISSPTEARLWKGLFDETGDIMDAEKLGTMEAFYKVLQKRIDDAPDEATKADLSAKLAFLKDSDCFKIK